MPIGAGALICAGLTIALLLASGRWTDRAYRQFDVIPAQYDFHGNATRDLVIDIACRIRGYFVVHPC